MKLSGLITALQAEQTKYGELEVHFANGNEHNVTGIKFVDAKKSANPASATGPHEFQPKRLVITGEILLT